MAIAEPWKARSGNLWYSVIRSFGGACSSKPSADQRLSHIVELRNSTYRLYVLKGLSGRSLSVTIENNIPRHLGRMMIGTADVSSGLNVRGAFVNSVVLSIAAINLVPSLRPTFFIPTQGHERQKRLSIFCCWASVPCVGLVFSSSGRVGGPEKAVGSSGYPWRA